MGKRNFNPAKASNIQKTSEINRRVAKSKLSGKKRDDFKSYLKTKFGMKGRK